MKTETKILIATKAISIAVILILAFLLTQPTPPIHVSVGMIDGFYIVVNDIDGDLNLYLTRNASAAIQYAIDSLANITNGDIQLYSGYYPLQGTFNMTHPIVIQGNATVYLVGEP